jgi:hypothetical protein
MNKMFLCLKKPARKPPNKYFNTIKHCILKNLMVLKKNEVTFSFGKPVFLP